MLLMGEDLRKLFGMLLGEVLGKWKNCKKVKKEMEILFF